MSDALELLQSDALDALAVAFGIPMRILRGREPNSELELYYDRIYTQQIKKHYEHMERTCDKIHFRAIVRPLMKKRKGRRPKFARCWSE